MHVIKLEKILSVKEKALYPTCLIGKKSCPTEDCGGMWSYIDLSETLKRPDHDEYESIVEWLGDELDPVHFDKEKVDKHLWNRNRNRLHCR